MMEFSVVEQDLKPMWLSEFPHWGFAHVYTILGGVWKAMEPSFPISVSEWPNWFCVSDGFWRWYVANRGKILSKKWICSVFSWDVVELDEDGIGTMWKYVKGTISGIFGAQMCSGWNVLRPVQPLQASPLGCLGWISLVAHVWHVTSCHKLPQAVMLLISPAALHIWDHLRDILRCFFNWSSVSTLFADFVGWSLPVLVEKTARCQEKSIMSWSSDASMWPKALKMLGSMVRSPDQKSGKSAYPLTISTISFYDFG